jgi:hypothetical protein
VKKIILVLSIMLLTTVSSSAKSGYRSGYVSVSHLHKVFNRVKRSSDVSQYALSRAFNYYEKNRFKKHLSPYYLAIADYTKLATTKRLYIINLHNGRVYRHLVAHGKNSGAMGGRVWHASNRLNSFQTPTGFFKVGRREGLTSKRYNYLGIEGLEWKNRNAKRREILLHTANYVKWGGRSGGCFAIVPQDRKKVFSRLKTALLYSYTGGR